MVLRNKKNIFLTAILSSFLILQQLGVWYGRSHRLQTQAIEAHQEAMQEVSQIEKAWCTAAVSNLITPQKISDLQELKNAKRRLQKVKCSIDQFQKQTGETKGETGEFLDQVHAYYNNSYIKLLATVDFLLSKKDQYSVNGSEIDFDTEKDAEKFRNLISQINALQEEKQTLNQFISNHNREVEKKLSSR